jgi:uridine kinase
VLLCDGVFLFRPELNDLWDLRLFVDTDPAEALRRGVERDRSWMGRRAAAEERYHVRYMPGERLYVEKIDPRRRADVIVENTDPASPKLLCRESG